MPHSVIARRAALSISAALFLAACQAETISAPPSVATVSASAVTNLRAHEPVGYTKIADNDWLGFSTSLPALGATKAGWTRYAAGSSGRAMIDALAPGSVNTLEVKFGGTQGTGPEHLQVAIPAGHTRLYLSVPVWVPAGYTGSSSGVQKLFHLWAPGDANSNLTTGGSMVVPAIFGTGSNKLSAQIRLQGVTVTPSQQVSFNLTGPTVNRGQWYVYECLFILNTASNANGVAQVWLDGNLVINRTNLVYSSANRTKNWTFLQLNPTYGGTGAVPPGVTLRYGRVYVSSAR